MASDAFLLARMGKADLDWSAMKSSEYVFSFSIVKPLGASWWVRRRGVPSWGWLGLACLIAAAVQTRL